MIPFRLVLVLVALGVRVYNDYAKQTVATSAVIDAESMRIG